MKPTETHTNLRRVATPYLGQGSIIVLVTAFLFYVAQTKVQWGLLWAAALIWILFAAYVLLFGLKYRVSWNEVGLTMTASGGPKRNIRFDEITEVRYETSKADELLPQARPFRRIVVLGRRRDPNALIDISLRHFRIEDIDGLLMAIKQRRPDVALPEIPLNR